MEISLMSNVLSITDKIRLFFAHYEQLFKTNVSLTELCRYMIFKSVKLINLIWSIKSFTTPNHNLCIEERLTIHKNMCDKRVTLMKKLEI